ncbi:MAG: hypothetical protein K0S75_672 [Clostridia bacterium]|nr:hypothetical protein [Clostridia bacterium]
MKKMNAIIILILLFLSGCARVSNTALPFKLDSDGNYTGFKEQAQKDGCYVSVDFNNFGGEQLWKEFIQAALNERDASIRIVNIVDNHTYFQDLFYIDGYYRIFDSTSEDLKDNKFKYLLELEGTLPNAAKSGKAAILTDDKNLTYKDVMWTFLSSDSNYSKSLTYKDVMWTFLSSDSNYSKSISPFKFVIMK